VQLKRLSSLSTISTNLLDNFRSSAEDETISVIHAPEGYGSFVSCMKPMKLPWADDMKATPRETVPTPGPRTADRSTPTPYQDDSITSTVSVDLQVPDDKVWSPYQRNSLEPN
jgi:hypothetical protein